MIKERREDNCFSAQHHVKVQKWNLTQVICSNWTIKTLVQRHNRRQRGGAGGASPLPPTAKCFFRRKIGVDEREGVHEKSDKKWHEKESVRPIKWCPTHANSSMYFFLQLNLFFLDSYEALIILQRAARKTYPRDNHWIWDNYIIFAQNYYNFTTLSTWVVYKYVCLKMRFCLKTKFSISFDITWNEKCLYASEILFHWLRG